MNVPLAALQTKPSQETLTNHYIAGLRQRFKAEVNRLTTGAMAAMLQELPDAEAMAFPLSYLYAWHWLRENMEPTYREQVVAPFRGSARGFLMQLLDNSADAETFLHGYIRHWTGSSADTVQLQGQQLQQLLAAREGDPERLVQAMLAAWNDLGLFNETQADAYSRLGHEERERYRDLLGEADRERLKLLDALPDPAPDSGSRRFAKLGLIPAMGCPQTCRHCMFIWRPPMRRVPDPAPLFEAVDRLTDSVLFTGGDLTRHLEHFYSAIRGMRHIRTFAILLNGEFANDMAVTQRILKAMDDALKARPKAWPQARILLQISFDELHQEIIPDAHGGLRERIPVANTANILECAPDFPRIQVCLLHKQNALNFSMDLFRRGVFGRLLEELAERGHQVRILASSPSPRHKRNPLQPQQSGQVLKDASFVLARHPDHPILLTSSTIDAYGRASRLDESEAVWERDFLHQVLKDGAPPGEFFDTDLMFWFNGWVTLFSAVHVCLGDVFADGMEKVLTRHRKDPLTAALRIFDRRLLAFYRELRPDLKQRLAAATGPYHLFHSLTEDAEVRLHMTRRLLEEAE